MTGLVLALTLIARCEPSHVVRGEQVTCTARLDPPGPFLLLEKKAVARGRTLVDRSRARFETGGEVHWSGPAVLDTEVSIQVRTADGSALAARTGFTVEPRRWPPLLLPGVVAPWDYGDDEIFGGWPPRARSDGLVLDGTLAALRVSQASPQVAYAEEGPDARWLYVARPAPPPSAHAYVSRALRPGDPFYEAQRGERGGIQEPCGARDLEDLRTRLLEHEGAIQSGRPSHFRESQGWFARRDLQTDLEAQALFYDDAVNGPTLGARLTGLITQTLGEMTREQSRTVDREGLVILRCRLARP
ncbi:MAG: hypothetical protein ACJ79V_05895 [Myxococcales bacterium]